MAGKTIVFTNGCFDLLHIGHIKCLEEASRLGDILIVALNADASVQSLKGLHRPILPEKHRALMLAALSCVTHVVIFTDSTPCELLTRIRPDILVKGGTYAADEIVGRDVVEHYGGIVTVVKAEAGISTSAIINHIASHDRQTTRFASPLNGHS